MTDLSEFTKESKPHRIGCAVSRLDLSSEQNEKVLAALGEPSITGEAIAKVLRTWGFQISGDTVTRHRSKKCSCD